MGDLTGAVLDGTYTVEHKLGAGGMGEVYAASHSRLAKRFAVKFLHGRMHAEDEAFARSAATATRSSVRRRWTGRSLVHVTREPCGGP